MGVRTFYRSNSTNVGRARRLRIGVIGTHSQVWEISGEASDGTICADFLAGASVDANANNLEVLMLSLDRLFVRLPSVKRQGFLSRVANTTRCVVAVRKLKMIHDVN